MIGMLCREKCLMLIILFLAVTMVGVLISVVTPVGTSHFAKAKRTELCKPVNGTGEMSNSKKGFTLIELIVVVIIVGVLAAVAIPMMSGNIAMAKRTEAVAAMGTIRTAERAVFSETGNYMNFAAGAFGTTANINTYIRTGDLNGKYYNDTCYAVTSNNIIVTAGMESSPAVNMNINGNIY